MHDHLNTKTLEDIPEPFLKYMKAGQDSINKISTTAKSDDTEDLLFLLFLMILLK